MLKPERIVHRVFLSIAAGVLVMPPCLALADDVPIVQVFKSPTCGCCSMWGDHLAESGFEVEVEDVADLDSIKQLAGVPDHLRACHTAVADGYTIEGHVPATAIRKLLAERPSIKGLAVPGMPAGSPGMPSPTPEPYDVIAFGKGNDQRFMTFIGTDPK